MRLLQNTCLWALLLALAACGVSTTGPSPDGGTQGPDSGTGIGRVTGQALLQGASAHDGISISLEGTSLSTTTDAQGRFSLENVTSGGYTVLARKAGYAEARSTVTVLAGQAANVTLNLQQEGGGILGTVEVEGLLDASGVSVTLIETGATTTTDALGQFQFSGLAPGTYTVALQRVDYLPTQQSVVVQPRGATLVTLTLSRERGSVAGVVELEGATNHMGAVVTLVEAGVTATTDAEGRFVFDGVTTGTYTVRARREAYVEAQRSVEVRANAQSEVTLSLLLVRGDVTGTVRLLDNAPPSGVTVTVMETGATATSDAQGRFAFAGLPLGTYNLTARKNGYADATRSVEVRAGAAATVSIDLVRSEGRVEGTARLEGASDHFGVTVVLTETGASTTTDSQGRFAFSVTSGAYTVEARRTGYVTTRQSVEVRQNETSTLSLTLARERGSVAGTLLLEGGGSPVDITVTLVGTAFSARTNGSGQFSFSSVPSGTYTLEATKAGYAPARPSVTVRANEQAQVNATLALARGDIEGVVLLEDAPTTSGISVALVENGSTLTTDAQGRFRFEALRAGTYTLTAWWNGYEREERTVEVRFEQTTTVNITLMRESGAVRGTVQLTGESNHAGVSVALSGHEAVATTDAQGHFVLEGVAAGRYTLTARRANYTKAETALDVRGGEPAAVNLSLERLGALEVSAPKLAVQGGHLTLTGSGFGEERGPFTITVGGRAVTDFISWSDTRVVVRVAHQVVPGEHDVVVTPGVPWRRSATTSVRVLAQETYAYTESWGVGILPSNDVTAWGETTPTGALYELPEGLTDVVSVAAARDTALALKADGTVRVWGGDLPGPLTVPAGLTDVVAIAAGEHFALALKADGTVVGWGDDRLGGATPPAGLTGVVSIAVTSGSSLALTADGTVLAWGHDEEADVSTPPGALGPVAALPGRAMSLSMVLGDDGRLSCWGDPALSYGLPSPDLVLRVPARQP
ncbi:carboxypeptidase regulatory-like domain-containing protein [Corallococcus macrosporus]|uniref:carboxypeptidase regulatory-like domain-containing protein n=1 Tax=Corallococcus macrosporus TaxID=35 RepID=UPI0002D32362|nr:carboxypeptidase regulatory-like domain-containing protein [Corallococcus macrosporus]